MNKLSSLSIVIPVFNEEATLEKILQDASIVGKQVAKKFEILVLDDASTDMTSKILDKFERKKLIKVLRHEVNQGIEAGLQDLYAAAQNEYAFFNAADDDVSMQVLIDMAHQIQATQSDIIIGNRIVKNYTWKRKIVSRTYNLLVWFLTGVHVWDAGAAKLIKTKYFKNLRLTSTSVFGEAERVVRAVKNGAIINKVDMVQNVGVERNDRISLKQLAHCLFDLFKLTLDLNFNKK